mmetsp:Transcript_32873/g.23759  ORF Transcript_32873/g.23759 Transcript_32873/m.23759 type:complete len:146 (-) Transcript_32873:929-1366(-)
MFPMLFMEFLGCFAMIAILVISNSGGLGGGGSQIPILLIFFKFTAVKAIAISNISIFTSAVMRYLMNFNQPHPSKNGRGVLVDYNIAVIMMPLVVSSSALGAIINNIIPESVVIIGLTIVIFGLAISTSLKAYGIRKAEKAKQAS